MSTVWKKKWSRLQAYRSVQQSCLIPVIQLNVVKYWMRYSVKVEPAVPSINHGNASSRLHHPMVSRVFSFRFPGLIFWQTLLDGLSSFFSPQIKDEFGGYRGSMCHSVQNDSGGELLCLKNRIWLPGLLGFKFDHVISFPVWFGCKNFIRGMSCECQSARRGRSVYSAAFQMRYVVWIPVFLGK